MGTCTVPPPPPFPSAWAQALSEDSRRPQLSRDILQELEDILDDDQDMADMYIGRRQEAQEHKAHRQASLASTIGDDHSEHGDFEHPPRSSSPGEHLQHQPASISGYQTRVRDLHMTWDHTGLLEGGWSCYFPSLPYRIYRSGPTAQGIAMEMVPGMHYPDTTLSAVLDASSCCWGDPSQFVLQGTSSCG